MAKADRPQLTHIVERGRLPSPHDGDNGAFTGLDLSGREKRSAPYVEHAAGSLHIENPGEVKVATRTFTHLSKLALSPDESAEWIAALAAER